MSTLHDLGEFGIIDRLLAGLPEAGDGMRAEVGPGDDAAVVRLSGPTLLATDLLVEGHHFFRDAIDPGDLAYKALAVNVSDLAAMGGAPAHALLSIALPRDLDLRWLDSFAEGLAEGCASLGVTVVGGDTTGGDLIAVNVAVTGTLPAGRSVLRSGARAGDVVCVTGSLGASAAGLRVLLANRADDADLAPQAACLVHAHVRPIPRTAEGIEAARRGASAMIDISDGLLADLGHIAQASWVAIDIDPEAVPVHRGIVPVAEALGFSALECALTGGEDYELAIGIAPEALDGLREALAALGTPLTQIGRVTEGSGVTVAGAPHAGGSGWDHFR